jgi:hypothetical protein
VGRARTEAGGAGDGGRVGHEAVVQRPARVPGQGVKRAARAAAAEDQHERGVGLEEAGQVTERGQLARLDDAGGRRCAEGDDHAAVEPRRQRVAAGGVLGGRDLLGGEGGGEQEAEGDAGEGADAARQKSRDHRT